MNHLDARRAALTSILAFVLLFCVSTHAVAASPAQRESLTPEEVELVRDNQELDKRTAVFVKAVERRMLAITNPQATPAKKEKLDEEKWGTLPPSTRAQFISDIARILDEAITNIDDASIHNEKSPLVPKAVRQLAAACHRLLPQLTSMRESAADEAEREWLEKAIENMQEITAAATKLPAEAEKKR